MSWPGAVIPIDGQVKVKEGVCVCATLSFGPYGRGEGVDFTR